MTMNCDIVGPHLESFNFLLKEGLQNAIQDIYPEQFQLPTKQIVELKFLDVYVSQPSISKEESVMNVLKVYPSECRMRGVSYRGKVRITLGVNVDGQALEPFEKVIGDLPIMVKSDLCHLKDMSPEELIRHGEEEKEMGGYFVVNGSEKIVRLLMVNRRNFPMAVCRDRWKIRGATYTDKGIFVRCVRGSHTATTNTLHYLMSRRMMLCFLHRKEMFFVPLMTVLRALMDTSDNKMYSTLICGRESDDTWKVSLANMFQDMRDDGIVSQRDALIQLGASFRGSIHAPSFWSDIDVGRFLIRKCILIHLDDNKEKFDFLSYMAQKLQAFVQGECREEDPDNIMFHEAALPGHILLLLLKEKFEYYLQHVRRFVEDEIKKRGSDVLFRLSDVMPKAMQYDITRPIEYFLATGNLVSQTGLGLQQATGFTILAERLNYLRFVSHFRGIHRGAYFVSMRATDVRKLRPEAWGFLCPVNTPDGSPCGLLNHMTALCRIVCTNESYVRKLTQLMSESGLVILDEYILLGVDRDESYYRVVVDSRWLGWVSERRVENMVRILRAAKLGRYGRHHVSPFTEIVFVPRPSKKSIRSLYPGLYVFTNPARLVRPVRNLTFESEEYVGTMEQVYLGICVSAKEAQPGITTHQEVQQNSILSFVANLIPFPDHNQSPRNVYQCQMGKQTMGVPCHAFRYRVDNKLYKLQTPQSPLVKPSAYDVYEIDRYPLGTNAIVAVISYTGYDMEDSMVINKASFERGFAHALVLKCERINLKADKSNRGRKLTFARDPSNRKLVEYMDVDGLPIVGRKYAEDEPLYCILDVDTGQYVTKTYHHFEEASVDHVKICANDSGSDILNHVCITWRAERNPSMGDKFASRHGQKGMMSFLWPTENMPFTESGMVPDIIFNPHGFPSRMTVGMMIEFLAGKSAALHGLRHDATPFVFSEQQPAVKYFGDLLIKAGYNYLGNEPIYSGVDGREMKADIFFGVVYYQKLRHMVEDKFQVRSTGPVEELTGQPIHGRKRGGGVRFGEMERDALISHGCAFLLQDRLFNCSDKDYTKICTKCGSIISIYQQTSPVQSLEFIDTTVMPFCRSCQSSESVKIVSVPTVLKLLVSEFACMNIKTVFNVSS